MHSLLSRKLTRFLLKIAFISHESLQLLQLVQANFLYPIIDAPGIAAIHPSRIPTGQTVRQNGRYEKIEVTTSATKRMPLTHS
jgi:hypothetical protein